MSKQQLPKKFYNFLDKAIQPTDQVKSKTMEEMGINLNLNVDFPPEDAKNLLSWGMKETKKWIILIIVLLIFFVVGYIWLSSRTEQESEINIDVKGDGAVGVVGDDNEITTKIVSDFIE